MSRCLAPARWLGASLFVILICGIPSFAVGKAPDRRAEVRIEKAEGSAVALVKLVEVIETAHHVESYRPTFRVGERMSDGDVFQALIQFHSRLDFSCNDVEKHPPQDRTLLLKANMRGSRHDDHAPQVVAPFRFWTLALNESRIIYQRNAQVFLRHRQGLEDRCPRSMDSGRFAPVHDSKVDEKGFPLGWFTLNSNGADPYPGSLTQSQSIPRNSICLPHFMHLVIGRLYIKEQCNQGGKA